MRKLKKPATQAAIPFPSFLDPTEALARLTEHFAAANTQAPPPGFRLVQDWADAWGVANITAQHRLTEALRAGLAERVPLRHNGVRAFCYRFPKKK